MPPSSHVKEPSVTTQYQHYAHDEFNTYCVVFLFCFVVLFLRLVYPMLPASLNFPYLIATSVFSNVYFLWYDSLGLSNNNVDIVFSAHGAFLEFL